MKLPHTNLVRYGLMFYELDMSDPDGRTPWKRDSEPPPLDSSFSSTIEQLMQITNLVDPNADLRGTPGNANNNLKRDIQSSAGVEAELGKVRGDG